MPAEGEYGMKRFWGALASLLLAVLALPAMIEAEQNKETLAAGRPLQLVCSTSIIQDVLRHVGGERVHVHALLQPGRDPHSYKPSPREMVYVEEADLVFVNGFGLEEGLWELLLAQGREKIVEVSQFVEPVHAKGHHHKDGYVHGTEHKHRHGHIREHEHPEKEHHPGNGRYQHPHDKGHDYMQEYHGRGGYHHHGTEDPHTWMSPLNVKLWCDCITRALSGADPACRDFYEENSRLYKAQLDKLDEKMRAVLARIPAARRRLVTDHDVFSYMERDYGIHVAGTIIPGFSTSAEPSARDMADLLAVLDKQGVSALLVAVSSGEGIQKLAQALERESSRPLRVLPFLTGTLAAPGNEGDSYISFMNYNLKQIVKGMMP